MRNIDTILIHCSATPAGKDFTVADIDRWHRARGFDRVGYHYIVYRDGTYVRGRSDDNVGAHCPQEGMNRRSLSICYIGGLGMKGVPADTRTPEQRRAIVTLIRTLLYRYPSITRVCGHRDVKGVVKACPCFDAGKEYDTILKGVKSSFANAKSSVNNVKSSFKGMMIPVMLAAMTLGGCSHKENADIPAVVTVEHTAVRIDSLRMESMQEDSVWIRDSIYVRDSGDTVRMEVWHWPCPERRRGKKMRRYGGEGDSGSCGAAGRGPGREGGGKRAPASSVETGADGIGDFIADLSALQNLGAVSMGVTQDIDSCGETVGVRTQTAAR